MTGRPPIFGTPEQMQTIIDTYFNDCVPTLLKDENGSVVTNKKTGNPVWQMNPPTLTGLALALGFCSRGTIYDYENKNDEFSDTIKKARLRCENYLEKGLLTDDIPPAAGIFLLKNYGWKDTLAHTGPDGGAIEIVFNDRTKKQV